MKVALCFDDTIDALKGLRAISEVEKHSGAIWTELVSREKSSIKSGDKDVPIRSFDELAALDVDCIICCDDSEGDANKICQALASPEKIFSPTEFVKKFSNSRPTLLFFTCVNRRYHFFATLYPLFALISNPEACVEIGVTDFKIFAQWYPNVINFYKTAYPDKVRYTPVVGVEKILPNSVRFLLQPTMKADYVYIGDADIFLLDENILDYHLDFMARHQSDFSNVLRNENQLTGLHCIAFDKMYPVVIPDGVDLLRTNDEVLLCRLMREKNLRFPVRATFEERKVHGAHISFFSRPPLKTKTTFDELSDFPEWGPIDYVEKYLAVRYSTPVKNFVKCIHPLQVELRKLIQFADMWAFFVKEHPDNFRG